MMWTRGSGEGRSEKMTFEPISAGLGGSLHAKSEGKNTLDTSSPMMFKMMLAFPGLARICIWGIYF